MSTFCAQILCCFSENHFDKRPHTVLNGPREIFSPVFKNHFTRSPIILTITSTVFFIAKEGMNSKRE